jgi:hypothetical protein
MPALRFYGFSHARRAIGPAFAIILALSTFAVSAASGTYVVLNEIANSSSTGMVRVSPDGAMVSTVSRAVWGTGIVEEANGNLVAVNGKTLQRLTPAFQVSTVATAPAGSNWIAVAIDGSGNFVVADNILHAIWRIFPDGAATLVAPYPVSYPQNMEGVSIALDSSGDYILAIDPGATGLLIRMTPAGKVSIVELARMPVAKGGSLAPDGKGNFLLGMNGAIYDVNLSGQIVLVASGSQLCCNLTGLALDQSTGEMLVTLNGVGGVPSLVKVSADGNTFTTLGTGNPDFSKPGAVLIDNLVISGAPAVSSMVHGATNIYTVLAPGEVFVIYGSGLGPTSSPISRLPPAYTGLNLPAPAFWLTGLPLRFSMPGIPKLPP